MIGGSDVVKASHGQKGQNKKRNKEVERLPRYFVTNPSIPVKLDAKLCRVAREGLGLSVTIQRYFTIYLVPDFYLPVRPGWVE